jgi:hypothetical protein
MKKTMALILIAIVAVSILSIVATANARSFMSWRLNRDDGFRGNGNAFSNSRHLAPQQSFVRIDGPLIKFGEANVTGGLQAQSRTVVINSTTVREGSTATAIWSTSQSPISSIRARENYTYTFYTARLVNASVSSLNVTGSSFFLNGTWNVFNVTTTFTVTTNTAGDVTGFDRDQNAVALATNAYGELKVASSGSSFALSITGVDTLSGTVHVQRITSRMFNSFRVNNDDTTTTVTKADIASVVSAYGASPGWGSYSQNMDYNFNYKIDITDLTTAAANLNAD